MAPFIRRLRAVAWVHLWWQVFYWFWLLFLLAYLVVLVLAFAGGWRPT